MMAWLPVFFMYFNAHLEIKHVLYLESLYYISVVILEVPSGMFSDRFGRRKTLIISSIFFLISYLIFGLLPPELTNFAIAQLMLAGGISFMSGTNTSFHYESLQDISKESEFSDREAKVQSYMQYGAAFAVLLGGFLGAIQLNLPYIASLIFIVPAVIITLMFKEPKIDADEIRTLNPLQQVYQALSYLKNVELKWIFMFSVVSYILAHIPYEFYQPYLQLLEQEGLSLGIDAAIYSGVLFAVTRIFGAYAAGNSVIWVRKYGLKKVCAFSIILQLFVIGTLGILLHPIIIVILLLRSFSMSLTTAPLNGEIAPRVSRSHRASFFSFQSLFSRLAFSLSLILLSFTVTHEVTNDWSTLSLILKTAFAGGLIFSIALLFVKSGRLFEKDLTN